VAISLLAGRFRLQSQALRQNEARLRQFIDLAPVPIAMFDTEMRYLAASQRWLADFQLAGHHLLGRSHYEVCPEVPERWKQAHRRCLAGAVERADEELFERVDGSRQWLRWEVRPWLSAPGRVGGLVMFTEDITERKQLQDHLEELVQERTARLHEALAELEHMSYSMIHDMRAPLRAMHGFAAVLQEEFAAKLPAPALDYLRRIREASNRLDHLLTGALSYNRVVRQRLPVAPVDLGRLLRGMLETYPSLHPPAADIAIDPAAEVLVLGNQSLLTQCFGNLLDNAVKFVAPGVHPRIRVWAQSLESPVANFKGLEPAQSAEAAATGHEPLPLHAHSRSSSRCLRIWIEDNGVGIPKEAQEKVFRMFQRMHHQGDYPGTGIGLPIVKKAVERMGGRVGLESEPGHGSRFWVELPLPAAAQTQQPLQRAA
jgi:PAS domain S-box-containing protein